MGGEKGTKRWWKRFRSRKTKDWERDEWTELHRCLQEGRSSEEIHKVIRNNKSDARQADVRGMTPLHWAAAKRVKLDAFRLILDAYPEAARVQDKAGMLPIHWAACGETEKMLRECTSEALKNRKLQHKCSAPSTSFQFNNMPVHCHEQCSGSDKQTRKLVALAKGFVRRTGQLVTGRKEHRTNRSVTGNMSETSAGRKYDCANRPPPRPSPTPDHCGRMLRGMQPTEQEQIVQYLAMEFPKGLLTKCSKCGSLPLHMAAASHSSAPVLQLLTSLCPPSSQAKNTTGWTPLHCIARNGANTNEITTLIDAYPPALWSRDKFGMTPLHVAAANDISPCTLQVLIDRYPSGLHLSDGYGMHPLHVAIESRATSCTLEVLLQADSKSTKQADHDGMLPLHLAVHFKAPEAFVQNLIQHNPDALSHTDANGMTCLHHAILRNCSTSLIEMLMKYGPKAVMIADNKGMLPIHMAESSKVIGMLYPRTPLVKLLHKSFKDDGGDCINGKDPPKAGSATDHISAMNQKLVREMSNALASVLPVDLVHMCIAPLISCT